jgi:3'(2'), 5'-bisphosphate nucleotidase
MATDRGRRAQSRLKKSGGPLWPTAIRNANPGEAEPAITERRSMKNLIDDRGALAAALAVTAHRAGQAIMRIYASDFAVAYKDDMSPVTAADEAAEAIILADLARLAPGIPVIAEETASKGNAPAAGERFFLVDPLDGTKEFLKKNGEFTVNIALVENRAPVFGLIYAPALAKFYLTTAKDEAFAADLPVDDAAPSLDAMALRPLRARAADPADIVCVASRSHLNEATAGFMRENGVTRTANIGSSLKFCLVAAGEADVYPRLAPTMEWDTAAGHAIVLAAGGTVAAEDGGPLLYGKNDADFLNPGFVVWGRRPASS